MPTDMNHYLEQLLKRTEGHVKLGLENTTRAMALFGNPHHQYRSILVAGSNGKGTTSAYIHRGLQLAGYKTGLFSSPHVVRLNERISIGGRPIEDEELRQLLEETFEACENNQVHLTFFEMMTVVGARYYARHQCDIAVIEVGLGGRLDSTNVHPNFASIVTTIALEHVAILGKDIETIAKEKLAILKEKTLLVTDASAAWGELARQKATDTKSQLVDASAWQLPETVGAALSYPYFEENFRLAAAFLAAMDITDTNLLEEVARTRVFGRMQPFCYRGNPALMDSAHNPPALEKMGSHILEHARRGGHKTVLITTLLADRELDPITKAFWESFDIIVLFPLKHHRGRKTFQELFSLVSHLDHSRVMVVQGPVKGISMVDNILAEGKHYSLVITGSIYLLGEILPLLEPHMAWEC